MDAQAAALNDKLVGLDRQIDAAVLTAIESEFEAQHAGICTELARLNVKVTAVNAFVHWMRSQPTTPAQLHLAEKLGPRTRFNFGFDVPTLDRAAAEWRTRAKEMAGD